MKKLLVDYTTYNVWANRKIIQLLKDNRSLIKKKTNSSFDTLAGTIQHIWFAEEIWLSRLEGSTRALASTYFKGKNKELLHAFEHCSMAFQHFVTNQPKSFFSDTCNFKATSGTDYAQTNQEIILHCMNHSTQHRGQIITMLRQLGATKMVSVDYMDYLQTK
jgi:uncharacterized damage-inducible protein DinB